MPSNLSRTMIQHTDIRCTYLAPHIVFTNRKHACSISASPTMQKLQMGSETGSITLSLACNPENLDIILENTQIYAPVPKDAGLDVDVIAPRLSGHRRRLVGGFTSHSFACTLWTTHFLTTLSCDSKCCSRQEGEKILSLLMLLVSVLCCVMGKKKN